jgi:putative tricarboxylic transport membrane protein
VIFGGDPTGFVTRPISGTILALLVVVVLWPILTRVVRRARPAATPAVEQPAADTRAKENVR